MPTFRRKSNENYDGPWILSEAALRSLDEVLDDIAASYTERREKDLESSEEERFRRELRYHREATEHEVVELRAVAHAAALEHAEPISRRWVFFLPNGVSAEFDSLAAAASAAELTNQVPIGFDAKLAYARSSVSVELSRDHDVLWTRTWPEDDNLAQSAASRVQSWAEANRPSWWLRLWHQTRLFIWVPVSFVIMLATFVMAAVTSSRPAESRALEAQAEALVARGISPQNLPQAVDLLLRKDFDLPGPQHHPPSLPGWYYVLVGGLVVLGIVLSFCPRKVVGLGNGRRRYASSMKWVTTVGYTVPSIIGGSVILPWILSLLGRVLNMPANQ